MTLLNLITYVAMIRDSSQILRATADTKENIQVVITYRHQLSPLNSLLFLTTPHPLQIFTSAGTSISSLPVIMPT